MSNSKQAVEKPKKRATASTEVVLGQAAQKIAKAVAELNSAVETVNQLNVQSEDLTLLVANKEEEIENLSVAYVEKSRQAKVDFELKMRENAEAVVNATLSANGKVAIDSEELEGLRRELAETKANADAETKKQVAIVSSTLKNQFDNDVRFLQSENKAIAAENASKIGTLSEKNKFLEDQVTKLYAQLDAERAAGIERAKASSIGTVTIGDSSNKR